MKSFLGMGLWGNLGFVVSQSTGMNLRFGLGKTLARSLSIVEVVVGGWGSTSPVEISFALAWDLSIVKHVAGGWGSTCPVELGLGCNLAWNLSIVKVVVGGSGSSTSSTCPVELGLGCNLAWNLSIVKVVAGGSGSTCPVEVFFSFILSKRSNLMWSFKSLSMGLVVELNSRGGWESDEGEDGKFHLDSRVINLNNYKRLFIVAL